MSKLAFSFDLDDGATVMFDLILQLFDAKETISLNRIKSIKTPRRGITSRGGCHGNAPERSKGWRFARVVGRQFWFGPAKRRNGELKGGIEKHQRYGDCSF